MNGRASGPRNRVIPVAGGALAVAEWGDPAAPPVLAVHGITASSRAWGALAQTLPGMRLVAPDLRGRGRSNRLPPPFGLREHADDLRRVLDDLDAEALPVVGHSMGAFVAVALAAEEPDRVSSLVLVDGGIPLALPPGLDREALATLDPATLLGPAGERLARVFASRADYRAFWGGHPAFADGIDELVGEYADYDLDPVEGGFRPSAVLAAVAADQRELFGPGWYRDALGTLTQPVTVLRAPLGLLAEPPGLYPPGALEAARAELLPQLRIVEVSGVNHYTIVMARQGAERVATAVRAAASATET